MKKVPLVLFFLLLAANLSFAQMEIEVAWTVQIPRNDYSRLDINDIFLEETGLWTAVGGWKSGTEALGIVLKSNRDGEIIDSIEVPDMMIYQVIPFENGDLLLGGREIYADSVKTGIGRYDTEAREFIWYHSSVDWNGLYFGDFRGIALLPDESAVLLCNIVSLQSPALITFDADGENTSTVYLDNLNLSFVMLRTSTDDGTLCLTGGRPSASSFNSWVGGITVDGETVWEAYDVERVGAYYNELIVLPDGYLAVGTLYSDGTHGTGLITKYDTIGGNVWETEVVAGDLANVHSVRYADDGHFVAVGTSFQDADSPRGCVVLFDEDGGIEDQRIIQPTQDGKLFCVSARNAWSNIFISGGNIINNGWLIGLEISGLGVKDEPSGALPANVSLSPAWPNPFNSTARFTYSIHRNSKVRISVSNALGKEIAVFNEGNRAAGKHSFMLDASGFASGTYFVRLDTPFGAATQRIVMVK